MASLVHGVPGFRSGTGWKKYVAIIGYFLIALCILGGFTSQNAGLIALGLEALLVVLLAANAWGLRSRVPALSSSNRLAAFGGWAGMLFIMFILLVAVSPRSETGTGTSASGPSGATGSAPGGQAASAPAAKPTQAPATATSVPPTRTPAPPTATPAPTATPSPESALAQAAQKQFGTRLREAKFSPISLGGVVETYVNVDYDMGTQWNEGTAVRSCASDLKSLAPKVFAIPGVDALELRSFTEFKDVYGKTTTEVAMKFTVSKEVAAKINWQDVNPRNFGVILTGNAGGVYVHPALSSAWYDYLAGK